MASALSLLPHVTVVRAGGPVSADLDGEVVILSVDNGKYYNLNEVGSRIWTLLEQPMSIATLIDRLAGEFEVERSACHDEVLAFLRELYADGLVRISEPLTYRRMAAVDMRPLTGAAILVDAQGNHFGINQVGVRIWELLEAPVAVEALIESLVLEFEISAARCRAEVETFLDQLLARGFVERTARR